MDSDSYTGVEGSFVPQSARKTHFFAQATHLLAGLFITLLSLSVSFGQSVGIGTNTPDSSAALEIKSSDRGLLIPRMSAAERAAITNPATGLLVYDTDTAGFMYFDGIQWYLIAF